MIKQVENYHEKLIDKVTKKTLVIISLRLHSRSFCNVSEVSKI